MSRIKAGDMGRIALFTASLAVCAWLVVPYAVPFTMQTFALFTAAAILGGKKATLSVVLYILLGVLGIPVFSGGRGGIGFLLGATGGYIIGFVPCVYIAGILCEKSKKRPVLMCLSMATGLLCDYIFGILWFYFVYLNGMQSLPYAIATGIAPFVGPDIIKILLACMVATKLQRIL